MQTYTIDIRPRRQTTIPKALLEKVGAKVGDQFMATVKKNEIVLKAKRQFALDAFAELQRIVKESGISEKEMQESALKIRKELYEKRYS